MKKILSLTWKTAVLFLTFFILPAAIASVVTLDLTVYMDCICHPAYDAVMFFTAMIATCACVDSLIEIS